MTYLPRHSHVLALATATLLSACLDWSSKRTRRADAGSDVDASEQPEPPDEKGGDDAGTARNDDPDAGEVETRDDDAGNSDGGEVESGASSDRCATAVGCSADAPCVVTDASYTCQGRYADFHFPVRASGTTPAQQQLAIQGQEILDGVTGLMWPRRCPTTRMTHTQAVAYCDTLELGAHGDYRLANLHELSTLWGADTAIDLDTALFQDCRDEITHSATPALEAPGSHWILHFGMVLAYWGDDTLAKTLCVRTDSSLAEPPSDRFVPFATDDALTFDHTTALMWESFVASTRVAVSYAEAEAYCAGLTVDDRGPFRLPTAAELTSFVDYAKPRGERVPLSFVGPTDTFYWSRTRYERDATQAIVVASDGQANPDSMTSARWAVRCVIDE